MKFITRPTITFEEIESEEKPSLLKRITSLNQAAPTRVFTAGNPVFSNVVIDFQYQPVAIGAFYPELRVEDVVLYGVTTLKALDNEWVVECSIGSAIQVLQQ